MLGDAHHAEAKVLSDPDTPSTQALGDGRESFMAGELSSPEQNTCCSSSRTMSPHLVQALPVGDRSWLSGARRGESDLQAHNDSHHMQHHVSGSHRIVGGQDFEAIGLATRLCPSGHRAMTLPITTV